jgi:hypothetical protein
VRDFGGGAPLVALDIASAANESFGTCPPFASELERYTRLAASTVQGVGRLAGAACFVVAAGLDTFGATAAGLWTTRATAGGRGVLLAGWHGVARLPLPEVGFELNLVIGVPPEVVGRPSMSVGGATNYRGTEVEFLPPNA